MARRRAPDRATRSNEAIGIAAIVVAVLVLVVPLAVAGLRALRPQRD